MATRAIRYDQLNNQVNKTVQDSVHWTNYRGYEQIWQPLQEAVDHNIKYASDSASEYITKMAFIRNEHNNCRNYYGLMSQVYAKLVPYLITAEMNDSLTDLMRRNLTIMRDRASSQSKPNLPYFHPESDTLFVDTMQEMTRAMHEFSDNFNKKFFAKTNARILSVGVHYTTVHSETTDEQIEDLLTTFNYGLWRINHLRLLHGGYNKSMLPHEYPTLGWDYIEGFMETLIDENPAIALMIARNDQFFQDNPMAQSIGHSWTSRNRSDDCWFKIPYDQVDKKHTLTFAPPRTFFGHFTPNIDQMYYQIMTLKTDIEQFIISIKPQIAIEVAAAESLIEKTHESQKESLLIMLQDLLDSEDTVGVGTALIGNISGIAHMAYDMEGLEIAEPTWSMQNCRIIYKYHDYTRNQDVSQHFYNNHITGILTLNDLNITDEVQGVLYQAYLDNLQQRREIHANQCARLARQIAQQTTRHDAEMKVLADSFTAYQKQV